MEPEGNQNKAARTGRFLGVVLIILGTMMLLARLVSFAAGPLAARSINRAIRHDVDRVTREAAQVAVEVGRIDVEPPVVRVAPVPPVPPVPPIPPFHPTPRLWWHMPGRRALTAFLLLIVAYLVLRRGNNRAPVAVPANAPETDRPPAV